MKEAYAVGASLNLLGNFDETLTKYIKKLAQSGVATDDFLKKLGVLNAEFEKVGALMDKIAPQFSVLNDELNLSKTAFSGVNSSLTGFNRRLSTSVDMMDVAADKAAVLRDELVGLGAASHFVGGGSGGRGKGGGGHGHGFHTERFRLGPVGYSFGGGAAAVGGTIAAFAGYEAYKQASDYQQAYAQFRALNLGAQANQSAAAYVQANNFPGVSSTELMQLLRDGTVIMKGNYHEAEQIAPLLAQMKYANTALGFNIGEDDYMKMLRIMEVRGGFKSPQEMALQMNMAEKSMTAYGGTITPRQYYNFMQSSGVAGQAVSDKTFWLTLAPLIQEIGGYRLGTGLSSMYSALSGGRMTTASSLEFGRLGLIKPGYAEYNKIGMIKRIKPGGIVDNEMLANHPADWFFNVLFPRLQKMGITTQQQTLQEMSILFSNSRAANLAAKIYLQQEKLVQELKMSSHAMDLNQVNKVVDSIPQAHFNKLVASLQTLGKTVGDLGMPDAIKGMDMLTKLFNVLNNAFKSRLFDTALATIINPETGVEMAYHSIKNHFRGASSKAEATHVHTTINLDGKAIAHVVSKHQAASASMPQSGPTFYNPAASYVSPLFNGNY